MASSLFSPVATVRTVSSGRSRPGVPETDLQRGGHAESRRGRSGQPAMTSPGTPGGPGLDGAEADFRSGPGEIVEFTTKKKGPRLAWNFRTSSRDDQVGGEAPDWMERCRWDSRFGWEWPGWVREWRRSVRGAGWSPGRSGGDRAGSRWRGFGSRPVGEGGWERGRQGGGSRAKSKVGEVRSDAGGEGRVAFGERSGGSGGSPADGAFGESGSSEAGATPYTRKAPERRAPGRCDGRERRVRSRPSGRFGLGQLALQETKVLFVALVSKVSAPLRSSSPSASQVQVMDCSMVRVHEEVS